MVEYMDEHPDVGLAGTLCYSPSYLTGRQYIENHPLFGDFRNPDFARRIPIGCSAMCKAASSSCGERCMRRSAASVTPSRTSTPTPNTATTPRAADGAG